MSRPARRSGRPDAVRIALTTGATSLRCYPRYEGRLSQIIAWTIADLRRLADFDPGGRLRYTLEQHEDLKSEELVQIIRAVANPRLSLLFDFGNMINAYETPMPALAIQAPEITEVHVKECLVEPDRCGWAHLACASGEGLLPMQAMFLDLLQLGEDRPQVLAFGLEEEGYFAPALRRPTDGPDPFIPAARQASPISGRETSRRVSAARRRPCTATSRRYGPCSTISRKKPKGPKDDCRNDLPAGLSGARPCHGGCRH
ncbi:MAG: hypothetical protein J7516_02040 [Shinella sp.]|nr:hypothetical protein [Shinella sp.]